MANPLVQWSFFVSNSFGDLATRIASIDRRKLRKNTARPNEFTDFEKFKVSHPKSPKTSLAMTWANHPGTGITLRLTALRVIWKSEIGGGPVFFGHVGGRLLAYFCHGDAFWARAKCRFLRQNFGNFEVVANPLVQSSFFVSNSFGDLAARIASIDRRKLRKNNTIPNKFTDFEKFKV